jgi:hypothetical protein
MIGAKIMREDAKILGRFNKKSLINLLRILAFWLLI